MIASSKKSIEDIMKDPNYFVQTPDKKLYAYWTFEVLKADLLMSEEKNVVIYKMATKMPLSYKPVTLEAFLDSWRNGDDL
jgi:hypothetical protein